MLLEDYLKIIEKFVKDYLLVARADGYVLGLSGGVDSSLVAALTKKAVGKDKLMCILMPIDSLSADLDDGLEIAKELDVNYIVIDASEGYHQLLKDMEKEGMTLDISTMSNLKARLRMSILYAYGQMHHSLVLGTDNADERYTGYFTKYGDGGVDLLPIAHLLKKEVVEAAKIYGLPKHFAERTPSAGLFPGQTDEKEMGITYKDLDNFLLGNKVAPEVEKRIIHLHNISEHKRKDIPTPEEFIR